MLCCSSITETVCADPAFASGWPGEAADVTQAANAIAAEMEISPRLASLVCMFDLPLRCSNANQAIFVSAAVQRSGRETSADNRPRLVAYDSATIQIYSR